MPFSNCGSDSTSITSSHSDAGAAEHQGLGTSAERLLWQAEKRQPWRDIVDMSKYATPMASFRERACHVDGEWSNVRLLQELDAKSR